jgi:transposase
MSTILGSSELLVKLRFGNPTEENLHPVTMNPQFLSCLLPGSNLLHLDHSEIDATCDRLTLNVSSTQVSVPCPLCYCETQRVHSRYERTLVDIPCVNFSLVLVIQVCKFFCDNSDCAHRIFTERIPEVAAPWARKTVRLMQQLQSIALALGGAAGARLAHQIGVQVCGSTLLNHLKRLALPPIAVPKILGVDDFAFRKGRQYGTVLVDLERHQPIALLSDRKAETLAAWLREHPGIELVSRDRAVAYKSGITQGAPDALQVADRFHLVQNLGEVLEQVFCGYRPELKAVEQKHRQALAPAETVVVSAKPTATAKTQEQFQATHQHRIEQQQEIKRLYEEGWTQIAIAQEVGLSERTVRRWLKLADFSEQPPRRSSFGKSILDGYKPAIVEWWNAGIREANRLMVMLEEKGYNGCKRTLERYLSQFREAQGSPPRRGQNSKNLPKVIDLQLPPLTTRKVSYLLLTRKENRDVEEQKLLSLLIAEHPDIARAIELSESFLQLIRQRKSDGFDDWLMSANESPFKPFKTFAAGLFEDYAAVKLGLTSDVSNGAVEGLNNRLKLLKRQMYGRAGLELLSRRFILSQ